jgi:hypothetical protein
MILPYSTWLKPRPPYSVAIFIPKAPMRRSSSTTCGG